MRLLNAIRSDIRFQIKQGFYFIYLIITVMYLVILSMVPENILTIALPLVVFSDPSVLGLFFIGGIIMLEKEQGIIQVLVISPLKTTEYIISKVVSLSLISTLSGLLLTIFGTKAYPDWILLTISIFLTSSVFTLCGIMINAGCNTVNQYIIKTIPYMLLLVLPCFSLIGFKYSYLFNIFPSVSALKLMLGAFTGIGTMEAILLILFLLFVNFLLFIKSVKIFENKIVYNE
jgi:fluoroquinolone transport system permease protein